MKKIILTIAFIASGMVASAQVGVGTQNPETSLHIVGKNATSVGTSGTNAPGELDATDGITVPVVTNDMTLTVPTNLVAGTKVSQMVYSNFTGKQGFYYWDGAAWAKVGGSATVTKSVRVATNGNLSNADLNGYIIDGAGYSYNLASLTGAVEGDTITFMQNSGSPLTINGPAAGSSTTPIQPGGGITFVYDADTTSWYSVNSF